MGVIESVGEAGRVDHGVGRGQSGSGREGW